MFFKQLPSGTSVEGQEIVAFKTEKNAEKYLYLIAGVHGDEAEGVHVLAELFNYLKQNTKLDLPIVVVPVVNVDGYKKGTRSNANKVDLNRNYPTSNWSPKCEDPQYFPGPGPLSEPENKFLIGLMDQYKPYFVLSFHSWKPILNYNGDCKDIADFLHQYNSYPVEGDIGYPTPGSFGYFGQERYNSPVLTFECPRVDVTGKTLHEIWEENKEGLVALFEKGVL